MKKHLLFLLAALAFSGVLLSGCNPEEQGQNNEDNGQTQETELQAFKNTVPVVQDWIFDKRPSITVQVENPNAKAVKADVKVVITTDAGVPVSTIEKSSEVPANGNLDFELSTSSDLAPGFYKARCSVSNKVAKEFVFGISPFDIVSAPDMQDDFEEFWETARGQLPALDETNVRMIEVTKRSTDKCKVYFVEFPSVPDSTGWEPTLVRGYYLEPQDGKKHPVLMHFFGYDTRPNPPKMSCPYGNSGDYAEFYLSHRGQYINGRPASKREDGVAEDFENIYGDWFVYHFGKEDCYYYRGAFMDCVQAVRFMASRSTSDMGNLFAEGSSQGGALCYAAAALSDYPFTAIAPNVAFLGDFPDYFKVAYWPANEAKKHKGKMTDQEMYAFLSYFDTKNLATRISCAVYATSGLQDTTCPPHTNLAPYSNLKSTDKEMHFYPLMTHDYPSNWTNTIMKYFKARTK